LVIPSTLHDEASDLLHAFRSAGWRIATAESCTGGLIAAALTEVAGSSDVVDRGFVTYSNAAKTDMLGVHPAVIADHGAVSAAVAEAMAAGALARSLADAAISVTGIAGPGGGSAEKPVGTVWFGCASRAGLVKTERLVFEGGRTEVRLATVRHALKLLGQTLSGGGPPPG
jgi:nicotinamide-nucleotide amidase